MLAGWGEDQVGRLARDEVYGAEQWHPERSVGRSLSDREADTNIDVTLDLTAGTAAMADRSLEENWGRPDPVQITWAAA